MSFTTALFLIVFLPICLLGYFIADNKYKNYYLCCVSILFYAWSGIAFLVLIMFSTFITYVIGISLEKLDYKWKKIIITIGIVYNLGVLFYFKYFVNFATWIIDILHIYMPEIKFNITSRMLPLGISFYTFSILSYLLDIYWEKSKAQKKLSSLLLYVLFFPKVMQGPIMRYSDFENQLIDRPFNMALVRQGIELFIKGCFKKIFIADQIAPLVIYSFNNAHNIDSITAWAGIIGYLLQLYYDFSGYSDMALGIGKIFGFDLPKNFDHPYMSKTVSEYWRRWHISLGHWFRDYLYMPVFRGVIGKTNPLTRKKITLDSCDLFALLVTWVLCGIWHGAGLTFLFYGLWYYLFISLERLRDIRRKKLIKAHKIEKKKDKFAFVIFSHLITLMAIIIGQILFRSLDFNSAVYYIKNLFNFNYYKSSTILLNLSNSIIIALIIGLIFSFPVYGWFKNKLTNMFKGKCKLAFGIRIAYDFGLLCTYILLILYVAGSGYSPFLYAVF